MWHRSALTRSSTALDGVLILGTQSKPACRTLHLDLMDCSCLGWRQQALPSQKMAWTINTGPIAVRHVRAARPFDRFTVRNNLQSRLGKRIVEVPRVDVDEMVCVGFWVLCCYWLLVRCQVALRCTRDQL